MNDKSNHELLTLILPDHVIGLRLDQGIAQLLPDHSRTQIKQWIEKGLLLINNKAATPKMKIQGGEEVTIHVPPKPILDHKAQDIPLDIAYEDDDLMIINKPIGLVVHPGAGNKDHTLLNALMHHHPPLTHLPRAGILHRIDKNTSGLLMIAKTDAAFKSLGRQLKNKTLVREYRAIVYGDFISGGTVDAPIDRHPINRKRMAIVDTGKPAITHYRIAEKFRYHTLLNVRLETGRTHQIRVHLSHIHHPIVGDDTYGGRVKLGKGMTPDLIHELRRFKRQALHAFALGFTHPSTQESMRVTVDLPADMQRLLTVLREDKKHA